MHPLSVIRGKLEKNADFSTVLHNFCHAQAASAVWASPTIEGDPRRALQALGMTDTDRLLEKSVFFSSLPLKDFDPFKNFLKKTDPPFAAVPPKPAALVSHKIDCGHPQLMIQFLF